MGYDVNSLRLQIMLTALGYSTRGIDGIIGRNTQNAIINFQNDYGLYASGQADQDTVNTAYDTFMNNSINASGLVVQALLWNAGYDPGTFDGIIGRKTRAACANFQQDQGLYASGEADDETIDALKGLLYGAG